jgi:predicted RNA-binding Zn-ribbon protein involved in translation (DUF1610 family)
MKCQACGFDDNRDGEFYKVFIIIPQSDYYTEIHVQGEEESVGEIVYACPKCGTLKIKIEAEDGEAWKE